MSAQPTRQKERVNIPNDGTDSGATSQRATFVLGVAGRTGAGAKVAVARQPDGGRGGCPGPGAEPEDDAEDVGNQSDDAVEEVRSPDLDGSGTAYDDERLDCLNAEDVKKGF